MSLRPKTVRRLAILSAVGAVTVGSVGFFWHRERQREFAEIESARHTGFDALKRGDYELAITDLRRYVTAHPEDVTALFALAQARVSVAQPNNAHLGEARQLLLQVLSLDPKHVDARRKLMSLYARARFSKELQEQADALLVQIPNDPESLRYRAIALAAQNKPTETLSAWTTYTNAKPDDILAQMETLVAMRRTGKSLDDVIVRAKKLIQDYPEDARFLIPLAWAHLERNEPTEALALLDKVSQNAQLDLDVARVVLDQYDRAGEFDRAQQLLERASQFQNDPKFSTLLIDRLWQRGQYETCVARIDDLNDNVRNLPRTQAIKAFSLRELGKTEDARTVAMVLAKKSDDVDAQNWASVLGSQFDAGSTLSSRLKTLRDTLLRWPDEAILLVEYARELTNAHEDALALTALDEAARRAPAWPLPHLERSRILFDTGDLNGARSASSQALRRSPTDPANVIQRTRVEMAIARSHPFGEDQMQLLTLLDQFVSAAPSNFEFRLAQLELMLRAGQNDKAKLVANRFQESDVELNRYSVESLAALGRIDADIHQRVLASMKSITLPADSYASIPASVTNTVIDDLTPDQRALVAAQTLAVRSDPTASQTWNDLATKAKDEVVLVTVLRDGFDSITDRTTQAALIERVKEITGPDSFNWRVAKMKWLLKSNMEADTREAVGLGTDLVRAAPQLIEGRRLLAKALFRTGNSTYALQHLREAVRLNPTDVKSVSDLVLALAQNGTTADNHTILTTLADQSQLNPNTTATIARLLLANQMKSTAQRFLTRARNAFAIDDSGALLLAEIDASTARQADAKAVFEQLLANNPTPEAIASAAIFFRQIDDESRADALVKKLVEASSRDANYSAALARVHYSNGNVDAARTSWKSALALAPTDRSIAQRAVAFEIDSANYSGATALAGQLLNRFADDTTIVRLRSKAQALATGIEDFAALDRLIESLQSDPEASDQLRVLRAMSALNQVASDDVVGRSKAQVELASALTELARKNPTALQLQTRAIDAQFVAGNREAACELARTMLTAQGNDASFASVATKTLHRAGMIAEARKAAIAWKKIKGVDPIEPDLLIAETQLHDSPADALKTIAPYVTQIEQSPDARPGALWLYANTLLANNRGGEACAWIDHLLERSASARATAPSLARSIDDLPAARTLLKRTGSFIKDEENSTRFAIVSAWLGLAQQTGTASDAESALAIAAPESARENASANWLLATAEAQRIAGHVQLAEEGLRRAMLRYPDDSNLLNSLAWLLYSTNRSGDEAKNLADRAIDADSNSTSAYETAGRIALAMNRTDDAERYFRRALSISNDNLEALLGLASLQRSRGQQSAANQTIAKIEQIVSDPKIARRLGPELLAQVNSLRNSTNGAVSNAN